MDRLPLNSNSAPVQFPDYLIQRCLLIIKSNGDRVLFGSLELYNTVYLFQDSTYPCPSSSGAASRNSQLNGFLGR